MAARMRPKGRPAAQRVAPAGRKSRNDRVEAAGQGGQGKAGRAAPKKADEAPPAPGGAFHARGLSPEKADALRARAHAVLDAQLRERLGSLRDRSQASMEELEKTVCECVREVGGSLLGGLMELDSWRTALEGAQQWPCPTCGQSSRRASLADGASVVEEETLQTGTGPVPWRGPVFLCRRCRRRFSPR